MYQDIIKVFGVGILIHNMTNVWRKIKKKTKTSIYHNVVTTVRKNTRTDRYLTFFYLVLTKLINRKSVKLLYIIN